MPSGFTGREPELRALLDALEPGAANASTSVPVTAVSGLGGVGKTALALPAAHEARRGNWFPGGVLFVDLHGYEGTPVTADLALQALLRALGVPPGQLPTGNEERGALYRTKLAEIARDRGPLLLFADNASSAGQVRDLLPGCSGHRVLITSRHRLAALGARLLTLDGLPTAAAVGLLDCALRTADPTDTRVANDTQSAALLTELCGRLPLALQIAAALLSTDPGTPLHELVTELIEARSRIDCLDDGERSVRTPSISPTAGCPKQKPACSVSLRFCRVRSRAWPLSRLSTASGSARCVACWPPSNERIWWSRGVVRGGGGCTISSGNTRRRRPQRRNAGRPGHG
ncbi:ATP-binding protein [Streptomyces sp. NPDC005921]